MKLRVNSFVFQLDTEEHVAVLFYPSELGWKVSVYRVDGVGSPYGKEWVYLVPASVMPTFQEAVDYVSMTFPLWVTPLDNVHENGSLIDLT